MHILLLEPFYGGSHRAWVDGLRTHSRHEIFPLVLGAHHWKWRMHGGAVTLARRMQETGFNPDLILSTDMLDLSLFAALTREQTAHIPLVLYMHENQLTYPWSPGDPDVKAKRDMHYAFINFSSVLAADRVLFNSPYHKQSFLDELPAFLKSFPDHQELIAIPDVVGKCRVLELGLDLKRFDDHRCGKADIPTVLWNHRWEYDKNPESFFRVLFALADEGMDFRLMVMGETFPDSPAIFEEARLRLEDRIDHWGYAEHFSTYATALWKSHVAPVTSVQDFFGISAVEAMYCGCLPLVPNRLAFPGHLPADYRDRCLYEDDRELKEKLGGVLRSLPSPEFMVPLQTHVGRYDWTRMVAEYDDVLEEVHADVSSKKGVHH
ncbi:MAG: DUF3524 domain-containing protein [Flavobacteriales bacterium]|nr:DUF3524 domain-containing protein [Flavobacteriales bacterium]